MKKLALFLLLVLPLVFTACTDDDNSESETIIGTWKSTGALPKEVDISGNAGLKMRIGNDLIETSGDGSSITFYESGQVTFSNGETGTYNINGKILTISYAGGDSVSSEFDIDGHVLTIYDDMTEEYTTTYPNETINKIIVARLYGKK